MIRLAALGLSHEANTFATGRVDLATFEACGVLRHEEITSAHADAATTMSGFLTARSWEDVELVPLLFTTVTPAGSITADALDPLVEEMTALLAGQGPWDGVLLALHGAAVAEHVADVDGHILARVRQVVGPDVPVGVALDLHANISERMAEHVDVLITYRTNPHVDARERAEETARLVVAAARGEIRPTPALRRLPAVINILAQNTQDEPMHTILAERAEVELAPGVLTASVAEGYPYADVPEMGMSAVVVTDADPTGARRLARRLASFVWDRRHAFFPSAATVTEAVRRAAAAPRGPVLLLDVGDNIGGGSPGDSVVLLAEARRLGLTGVLAIINDPAGAARCHEAGTGARVGLTIGASTDPHVGPPIDIAGTVRHVHDGRYHDTGPTHTGQRDFDTGPTSVIDTEDGTTIVLTSKVVMPSSRAQLTVLGLDPLNHTAIIAKGVHSPLAAYGPIARQIIQVDSPGVTSADLDRFTYTRRPRPLYPFDSDVTYQPD